MHRWMVWNVLMPLHEGLKGHPSFRILRELEAAEVLDVDGMMNLRAEKLRRLIAYAHQNVPYVRRIMDEAGIGVSGIQTPADLRKLPLMRKADVRANRESMRSRIAGKLTQFSTGGSTGEPLIY